MSYHVIVVLVEPQGDANIGATARAMKNFGFGDLRLVNPAPHLTKSAYMWAVEARNVLESAKIYKTLDEALADVAYAAAFTRRIGRGRKRHMMISKAAPVISARAKHGGAAIVFGREDKGLSNAEIKRCDAVVEIPTSAALPSLNLAQSVLLGCYEISKSVDAAHNPKKCIAPRAQELFLSRREIATSLIQIDKMLHILGYKDTKKIPLRLKIIAQFEKIFGRAGLTPRDAGMIEGLVARITSMCNRF